jgi:hypothetical protein
VPGGSTMTQLRRRFETNTFCSAMGEARSGLQKKMRLPDGTTKNCYVIWASFVDGDGNTENRETHGNAAHANWESRTKIPQGHGQGWGLRQRAQRENTDAGAISAQGGGDSHFIQHSMQHGFCI